MIGRPYLDRLSWIARAFGQGFADDVSFYAESGKRLSEAEELVAKEYAYDVAEGDTLESIALRLWAAEERIDRQAEMSLAHGF